MFSTVEILKATRQKISDPARWCQYEDARDRSCTPVNALSTQACRWCVEGALIVVCHDKKVAFDPVLNKLTKYFGKLPHEVNDTCAHNELLGFLDRAIEKEEDRDAQIR